MSNYIYKILSTCLAAACFLQTAAGQLWRRADIDDGLVAKDTYCLFSSIRLGQSIEWIEACRSSSHVPCGGKLAYFASSNQMAAIADFISLWYRGGRDLYYKSDDFTLWRLSAYMPPRKYIHSIKDRFDFLSMQIDSLLCYEKDSQWDYNLGAWLEMDMYAFKVRMLDMELNKINAIFQAENDAFEKYMESSEVVYDYMIEGSDGYHGSSSAMTWADFNKDRYIMRQLSIEGMLFYLSDAIIPSETNYSEFTIDLVNDEYEKYIESLPILADDYTAEERAAALKKEQDAWNNWLGVRKDIVQSLPTDQQSIYHHQTDLICRYKCIILKNRNLGYGIISASLEKNLVRWEWSDDKILNSNI